MLVLLYILLFMLYFLCLITFQLCFITINIWITLSCSLLATFMTYLVIRHYIYTPSQSKTNTYHHEQRSLLQVLHYDNDEEESILT